MPAYRDIVRRIDSIKNTQKITKAMQVVAATRLRRAQQAVQAARPYAEQIKPTNFGLSVSTAALGYPIDVDPARFHLVAEYERNPARWRTMDWLNKYSGEMYQIAVGRDAPADRVQVKSYGDVLMEYRVHPEPKSRGTDGCPCDRASLSKAGGYTQNPCSGHFEC